MLGEYLPVLLQILVAILFAASALVVSVLVGKSGKRTPAKDTPYECGMIPQGERQPRFSVKFYVVATLTRSKKGPWILKGKDEQNRHLENTRDVFSPRVSIRRFHISLRLPGVLNAALHQSRWRRH